MEGAPPKKDALPEPWQVAAAIAAAIAGTAGYLYLLGGVVTWLRLRAVGIPPDDVVASLPRGQLLVVGLSAIIGPVIGVAIGAAALVRTKLSARQFSGVFTAAALWFAVREANVGKGYEIAFGVVAVILLSPIVYLRAMEVLKHPAPLQQWLQGHQSLERAAYLLSVLLGIFFAWLVVGSLILLIAVAVTAAVSYFAGNWLEETKSLTAVLARGLLVAALIGFAFRFVTEYEPPSPLEPAIVYSSTTSNCKVSEPARPHSKAGLPCSLSGYLVGTTSDATYLALPLEQKTKLIDLRADPATTGRLARIPNDSIIEVRTLKTTDVSQTKEEEPPIEDLVP
jgi:hypothetical protein